MNISRTQRLDDTEISWIKSTSRRENRENERNRRHEVNSKSFEMIAVRIILIETSPFNYFFVSISKLRVFQYLSRNLVLFAENNEENS